MRAFYFYIDDWLSSKHIEKMDAHEERGYLRLILAAASEEGCPSLPDDDQELAILSKLGPQWSKPTKDRYKRIGDRTSGEKLRACFEFKPVNAVAGRLYNEKLYGEWSKQQVAREAQSRAGREGNRRRWGEPNRDRVPIATREKCDRVVVATTVDGNALKTKEDPSKNAPHKCVIELLIAFPGAEGLPGGPDEEIVSRCLAIAHGDVEELGTALRALYLRGHKPEISWAWFTKVLPQFVQKQQ